MGLATSQEKKSSSHSSVGRPGEEMGAVSMKADDVLASIAPTGDMVDGPRESGCGGRAIQTANYPWTHNS
jgi:hypothetical protein